MPETFDYATANPGSGGANLAGDVFSQGGTSKFLPAGFIAYGPQDGPYERVDAATGMPVQELAGSPQSAYVKGTSIAAGASTSLESTAISDTKTGQLLMVEVSSSVPFRVELRAVADGVAGNIVGHGFSRGGETWLWRAPVRNLVTLAAAGNDQDFFRVTITNLDISLPADMHAVFSWNEV